jgi:hypothetical protein
MDKLDILLNQSPMKLAVRKTLTQDTLDTLIQVKRTRLARQMLGGLFIVAILFLIAKWLSNDLGYLLQLGLFKFSLIKNQSSLYVAAFIESIPKQYLFTLSIIALLWFGWKRFETFLLHSRITHTKQKLTMRIIKLTPKLLLLNIVVVLTILGLTGYTYAQKNEQEKLQILREHINQSGRTEFETNISPNECDTTNNPNLTNQFEIKKGTKVTSADSIKIIEAWCNTTAAEKFLWKHFPLTSKHFDPLDQTSTGIIGQIVEKNDNNLLINPPGYTGYNFNPALETFTLTPETKIFKDKTLVPQDTLQKGDIVMFMMHYRYASEKGGGPVSKETLGVYILPTDPEFTWYNLDLQHSITQIEMCSGNPQDRCSFTGSFDFFPSGGGEGNTINPLYVQNNQGEMKKIAGVLTEINETYVKIKSSSGRIFTIEFGSNPTEDFNRDRYQYYNNDKVTLGDTLLVTYNEPSNEHGTTIHSHQIFNAVIMIEFIGKTQPIKKY